MQHFFFVGLDVFEIHGAQLLRKVGSSWNPGFAPARGLMKHLFVFEHLIFVGITMAFFQHLNFHVDHFLDAGTGSRGAEEDRNSDCCLRQHSTIFSTFSLFSPRLLACALKKKIFFPCETWRVS